MRGNDGWLLRLRSLPDPGQILRTARIAGESTGRDRTHNWKKQIPAPPLLAGVERRFFTETLRRQQGGLSVAMPVAGFTRLKKPVHQAEYQDFFESLPEPDFLPPPDILFSVAHARRSASSFETPLLRCGAPGVSACPYRAICLLAAWHASCDDCIGEIGNGTPQLISGWYFKARECQPAIFCHGHGYSVRWRTLFPFSVCLDKKRICSA
jgi:hypothetical protein